MVKGYSHPFFCPFHDFPFADEIFFLRHNRMIYRPGTDRFFSPPDRNGMWQKIYSSTWNCTDPFCFWFLFPPRGGWCSVKTRVMILLRHDTALLLLLCRRLPHFTVGCLAVPQKQHLIPFEMKAKPNKTQRNNSLRINFRNRTTKTLESLAIEPLFSALHTQSFTRTSHGGSPNSLTPTDGG